MLLVELFRSRPFLSDVVALHLVELLLEAIVTDEGFDLITRQEIVHGVVFPPHRLPAVVAVALVVSAAVMETYQHEAGVHYVAGVIWSWLVLQFLVADQAVNLLDLASGTEVHVFPQEIQVGFLFFTGPLGCAVVAFSFEATLFAQPLLFPNTCCNRAIFIAVLATVFQTAVCVVCIKHVCHSWWGRS